MNVTELARQLKITTEELFDSLPELGFDIGRRAIKVDDLIAYKIIEAWQKNKKKDKELSRIEEIRGEKVEEEKEEEKEEKITEIKIPETITVREFAGLANLPVNEMLKELMNNGVFISMNERIDFDTASIVGEELGFKVVADEKKATEERSDIKAQKKLKKAAQTGDILEQRPPVVVVMGHVDHGKTKILDAIRKADVVAGESGGITQHIGAYQVHHNKRILTFIDTPGHEAFTAMRSRGARVADVAILVIAADDSIQPQTKEAIRIIQDAKLPFVVAINKIDKPEANIDKVKTDLANAKLQPEDWGGKVICVPVSATEGTGIEDLIDTVLLIADMEKENLQTDVKRLAIGTIIESHIDKGEGSVATILVQVGTLKVGDILSIEGNYYGKVRSLKDYNGQNLLKATPGTPVKILGLKVAPQVGNIMEAVKNTKLLNKDFKKHKIQHERDFSIQAQQSDDEDSIAKFINLIIKGDVLGSVEAIVESLAKLETKETKIKIISKGLGSITEADVLKAEATNSKIIGFHIKPTVAVEDLARSKEVEIKSYEVIYHLIEDIEKDMAGLKEKEVVRELIGKLEVLKIFRKETSNMIIGGRVIEGTLKLSDIVIVVRGDKPITSGKVIRLECGKSQVEEVKAGTECGAGFEGNPVIEEGDILEFYEEMEK